MFMPSKILANMKERASNEAKEEGEGLQDDKQLLAIARAEIAALKSENTELRSEIKRMQTL